MAVYRNIERQITTGWRRHWELRINCSGANGGLTRTDQIGVCQGGEMGGTDISCNIYGQEVHGADTTKLSGLPPTCWRDAGDADGKYAGLVRAIVSHVILTFQHRRRKTTKANDEIDRKLVKSLEKQNLMRMRQSSFLSYRL